MSRRVALALLVALVAAGVLGMHTLGLHGTAHAGHGDVAATAGQAAGHSAGHSVGHSAGLASGADGTSAAPADDPLGAPADGVATACLFLLVLGALVALLGPLARRPVGTWRLAPPGQRAPRPVVRRVVLPTRPPPVWEHSVVRC